MQNAGEPQADWIEISVGSHKEGVDALEDWLFEAGALSVTLRDGVDDEQLDHAVLEPAPGELRLWEAVTVVGLFAQGSQERETRDALSLAAVLKSIQLPEYTLKTLQDKVWERAWMDEFKPMRFGSRLWIYPKEADHEQSEDIVIRLDPGLAFGTGTHATTAQCLQWLGEQTASCLSPLSGKTVIDFGCGSGVLAIAALLLGAERAWAVDIDGQALLATRENAEFNEVSDRLSAGLPETLQDVRADILLANILFQPLMDLAETFAERVVSGGALIMSGVLESQVQPLHQRYAPNFNFVSKQASDGWALMIAQRG